MKKHLFKLERLQYYGHGHNSTFLINADIIYNVYDNNDVLSNNLKYTYNTKTGILSVLSDTKEVYVETNVTLLDIRKKKLDSL